MPARDFLVQQGGFPTAVAGGAILGHYYLQLFSTDTSIHSTQVPRPIDGKKKKFYNFSIFPILSHLSMRQCAGILV